MTTPPRDPHAPAPPRRSGTAAPRPRLLATTGANAPDQPDPAAKAAAPEGTLRSDNLRLPDPDAGRLPKSARNVLSRDEIEALLNPDLDDLPIRAPEPREKRQAGAADAPYEDAAAAKAKALMTACDALIARLSHALQAPGAVGAVLRLSAAESRPFRATLDAHPGNGVFVCLSDEAGRVGAALTLSPDAASALIERAGGASEALALSAPARSLTALDESLLAGALAPVLTLFPALTTVRLYADRLRAGATVPPGDAIRLTLTLQIGTRAWPSTMLVSTMLVSTGSLAPADQAPSPNHAPDAPPVIAHEPKTGPAAGLTTVLTARVASLSVPLSRLSGLKPGMTLSLGLPADTPVSLHSGDTTGPVVAEAALGREGNRVALRLIRKSKAYS